MFGSVALDVVTGMVLIYLLYSLLATILGEMISSWLGMRSRVLRRAIGRMLNDEHAANMSNWTIQSLRRRVGEFFLHEYKDSRRTFAGKFYDYPGIKYMAEKQNRLFSSSKPSYLSKEAFAQTLIHLFRGKGAGSSDIEKIEFCLKFNTLHIEPQTLSYLRNVLADANGSSGAFVQGLQNWFEETMDRTTGWYKRKNRLILFFIGLAIAVSLNVDSIKIAQLLSRDKDARSQMVSLGVAVVRDSTKFKPFVDGNGDSVTSTALLDSGFVNVSNDLKKANLILGEGWDFSSLTDSCAKRVQVLDPLEWFWVHNMVDTIASYNDSIKEIESKPIFYWSRDNIGRLHRAQLSTMKSRRSGYIITLNEVTNSRFVEVNSCVDSTMMDTSCVKTGTDTAWVHKIIATIRSKDESIKKISGVPASPWSRDSLGRSRKAQLSEAKVQYQTCLDSLNELLDSRFVEVDTCNGALISDTTKLVVKGRIPQSLLIEGQVPSGFGRRAQYVAGGFVSHFWGFLITAIMLSLGAPFWFNLLQKLLSLRSAGVKPEEKESGGTAGEKESAAEPLLGGVLAAPTPVQAEAPVDTAMRIYGEEIRNESGVVGVVRGYCRTNGATQRCLQVNVTDSRSAVVLRSKYPRLAVADDQTVPMNVAVTGKPCLRNGVPSYFKNPDRAVANKVNVNGWGSAGCIVEDEFSPQKFLLSCFHVLNGSRRWDAIEGSKEIVADAAQTIANDYDGYLTQYLDVARALVTDDTAKEYVRKFPSPKSCKDVSPGDVFVTNVAINGARSGSITGTIVNDSMPYHFDYKVSATEAISHEIDDLFAISHMDINGNVSSITQEGDSGSLVVSDGNVLGMVVGGDSQYTYAMKMTRILSFLSVTLEVQV